MKRFCFALDLKDDPKMIQEYKEYHKDVWLEIKKSIYDGGIQDMQIYCIGNRLFMIMEADDTFDLKVKAVMDTANPKVQEWEELMWKYQQQLPQAKAGEKWVLMTKIFQL